jgi:hypothetical protein
MVDVTSRVFLGFRVFETALSSSGGVAYVVRVSNRTRRE